MHDVPFRVPAAGAWLNASGALGVPLPVDAGDHQIVVRTPDGKAYGANGARATTTHASVDRKRLLALAAVSIIGAPAFGALKGGTRLEITTFRQEVYAEQNRKPAVTFGNDIETDLGRRDFTINAMAVRLPGGELIDPYGGVAALGARVLDTPTDPSVAFSDDPLRMIRAARFVAQLDVAPADRILEGIRSMRDRLDIVAVERMQAEIDKLLVAEHPAKGLSLLVETGLADIFLPELPALQLEQDPVHQHKDVLGHTYAVVERCEADLVLRLAGLLHDIGKPKTRQITPEGVSFHHHEIVGARMARERLTALRYPKTTLLLNFLLIPAVVPLALSLGSEFMPQLREGSLMYMPTGLPMMAVEQAREILVKTDGMIMTFPEVQSVLGKSGKFESSTDPAPIEMFETTIVLKP